MGPGREFCEKGAVLGLMNKRIELNLQDSFQLFPGLLDWESSSHEREIMGHLNKLDGGARFAVRMVYPDHGLDDISSLPFLQLKLCQGGDLKSLLDRTPLEEEEAVR